MLDFALAAIVDKDNGMLVGAMDATSSVIAMVVFFSVYFEAC